MILPALNRGGYSYQTQQNIGPRFGGGKHLVDVVAQHGDKRILVSLKWQQVSGTAEQKVPFEVMCLADAVLAGRFSKAYLVLGGEGWKLRNFYIGGGLEQHLIHAEKVEILTLERFVARANQGNL
jgi:PD-(D/E)XK nuclease superfamily domain